jgi:hypothetical protein
MAPRGVIAWRPRTGTRSTLDLARHRFGEGEYRYFAEPLPEAVVALRAALYPRLLPIARDWWSSSELLGGMPRDLFVVGLVVGEAAVQAADQAVGQGSERLAVRLAAGAMGVVAGSCSRSTAA